MRRAPQESEEEEKLQSATAIDALDEAMRVMLNFNDRLNRTPSQEKPKAVASSTTISDFHWDVASSDSSNVACDESKKEVRLGSNTTLKHAFVLSAEQISPKG